MDELETYLGKVTSDIHMTWDGYRKLEAKKNGVPIQTQPIPFFGDIENARILTVGVNPSAGEFDGNRSWPGEIEKMTVSDLSNHLQSYFTSEQHEWFDIWSEALKPLGASYQAGEAHLAAHIDLSPRATIAMENAKTCGYEKDFKAMIEQDVKWFFRLLQRLNQTRLLLFAGCVANQYMNDFVRRVAHIHNFEFKGSLASKKGKARTGFYHLRGPDVSLPAFFCSVSPSARNAEMLPQRIREHKEKLLELLNGRPDPATL